MKLKYCYKCELTKELEDFGKDRNRPDGRKLSCKECRNKENKSRRDADPSKHRKVNLEYARSEIGKYKQWSNSLRRKFWPHLTNEQAVQAYNDLLIAQKYCCGMCGKHQSEFKMRLAVDHCHDSLKVRGLLCNRCNRFEVGRHTLATAKLLVSYLDKAA